MCILCRARFENDFGNGKRRQKGEAMDAAEIATLYWDFFLYLLQICTVSVASTTFCIKGRPLTMG